jgi:flagellar biosynthesis protein FlhG
MRKDRELNLEGKPADRPWIISIASGKGGVGKTLTTVNMALAARRLGLSTMILDGDFGMANVDVVMGMRARYNLGDVLESRCELKDIILEGPLGVRIIPSGSGLAQLADLKLVQRVQLLDKIAEISQPYQLLLIDSGAGISSNVLHLNSIADEIMVVTTPEPHALTDAYAFLKVMNENYARKNFNIIVNQAISEAQGLKIYQRVADVARRFLEIDLMLAGTVPKDALVERSVMMQRAADEHITHTRSGQAWNEITRKILERLTEYRDPSGKRGWQDLMFPQPSLRSVNAI